MNRSRRAPLAYCGLYCGDCFLYTGEVADLARDLRAALRKNRFDIFAAAVPFRGLRKYLECYEALGAMVKLRCRRGCPGGGGPPFCNIRSCCLWNGYAGCWECSVFASCAKLKRLEKVHGSAHLGNIRRLKRVGVDRFIAGPRKWYSK